MAQVFVSYARSDSDRVAPLARALESRGWSVWWDRHIPPGMTFDEVVERELDAASVVVVVWTEASAISRWVRTEAGEGLERDVLVPVLMDHVRIPLAFRRVQSANLVDWVPGAPHDGFEDVADAVARLLESGGPGRGATLQHPSEGDSRGGGGARLNGVVEGSDDVAAGVTSALAEMVGVGVSTITPTDVLGDDLDLDDLDLIELVMMIEEEFAVAISDDDMSLELSVAEFVDLVRRTREAA